MIDLNALTSLAKRLVKQGKYRISYHALHDHPERNITAVDIIEAIKVGAVKQLEPRDDGSTSRYEGADRYRWLGQDIADRVLRLIVVIEEKCIIVSAAIANGDEEEQYAKEDLVNSQEQGSIR